MKLARLRQSLVAEGWDALIVTKVPNGVFLSGFTGGEAFLLISAEEALLFTDFRYTEQAEAEAPDFHVIEVVEKPAEVLAREITRIGCAKVGFEADDVDYRRYTAWKDALPLVVLVPTTGVVERLRHVKTPDEIATIRQAASIADEAFLEILPMIKPGARERDVALELEFAMRRRGAEKLAFPTILASGPRGSLPHGVASEKVISRGELVTIDFGAVFNFYCSDATRTVVVGEADARQKEIYEIVLAAQRKAVAAIRPGVTGAEVDAVARQIISDHGHAEHFGHGLGHGVGLEVHEGPRLSKTGKDTLVPGMVVTAEPGIYVAGWGGVRIEDLVLVTENGAEVLTGLPKELMSPV